jgi:C4-dicarboxylate-specific signal transduction histidine kinase
MNVTQRNGAKDDLHQAESAVARLSQLTAMGNLAALIAHEVNQPLAAIVTNAESCLLWLGKEQPDLDMARQAAQRIVRNSHHASEVINGVRAMLGRSSPTLARLDINQVVRDALDLMSQDLTQHKVKVETRLADGVARILGDRTQLQQVLVNLIKNGIEAMSARPTHSRRLLVSTALDAGAVVIGVADSGMGVDAATMLRMFEPFFTTKRDGMGLGLSICRSIVEAHGGSLWASPRARQGTIFQFRLPTVR